METKIVAVLAAVALLAFIYFMLSNRKGKEQGEEEEGSCGRIFCEPIVPVEERNEAGVGPDERKIEGDLGAHHVAQKEACDKPTKKES